MALGIASAGCSDGCSGDDAVCPSAFKAGESCEREDQECPYPGAKCESTRCTCRNQPGGLFWTCSIEHCKCTCPCGRVAVNSCEALSCSKAEDPCPASAQPICAVICVDAGPPEAGPDAPVDGPRDAPTEHRGDLPREQAPPPDLPVPDGG